MMANWASRSEPYLAKQRPAGSATGMGLSCVVAGKGYQQLRHQIKVTRASLTPLGSPKKANKPNLIIILLYSYKGLVDTT